MERADLLVDRCGELLTCANEGPKKGAALDDLGLVADGAVAVRDGRIAAAGPARAVKARFKAERVIDAKGGVVMPGFVDPHTHPVFAATREKEFDMRVRGRSYVEITRAGGGIFSSVRAMRAASTETLTRLLRERCDRFIESGTTTIEAKSGYGLNREDELRALEIIRDVNAAHPLDLVPTFLGAHEIPEEYAGRPEDYLRLLAEEVLPEVRRRGLAEFCDVFCEKHVYGVEEARRFMTAARDLGFKLRFHADEIEPLGGAELAARLGAASADHLVRVSEAGMDAMAAAGVIPVLLPATVFSLGLDRYPPARAMIDRGLPVALATDFNPGTSYTQSMPAVINIACCCMKLTVAEAINAATVNAAWSLGRGREIGALAPGMRADLILLDCPNHLFLGYRLGWNPVDGVIKNGEVVYERPAAPRPGG